MVKRFIFCFLIIVMSGSNSYGQTEDSWEKAKQLGETALRMVASSGTFSGMNNSGRTTYSVELIRFHSQLKAGADPTIIRISGFVPSEVVDGNDSEAVSRVKSSGKPFIAKLDSNKLITIGKLGKVVSVKEGGMTLIAYFQVNNLSDACELLKKYNRKQKTSFSKELGGKKISSSK